MRTSRISRDTSKVLSSLAATRTQRPLRGTRAGANATIRDFALNAVEAGHVASAPVGESEPPDNQENIGSDSGLSSPPEDSGSEGADVMASRKRKRGQDAPVATSIKREVKEISVTDVASPKKVNTKPKKARRAPAKKIVGANGSVKVEPPPHWEEIYALTRQMRNENVAPVDTMGCESLADRAVSPRDQRFQTLVALMLSSQTKDTVTSVAIKGMQDNMPGVRNRRHSGMSNADQIRASTWNLSWPLSPLH